MISLWYVLISSIFECGRENRPKRGEQGNWFTFSRQRCYKSFYLSPYPPSSHVQVHMQKFGVFRNDDVCEKWIIKDSSKDAYTLSYWDTKFGLPCNILLIDK